MLIVVGTLQPGGTVTEAAPEVGVTELGLVVDAVAVELAFAACVVDDDGVDEGKVLVALVLIPLLVAAIDVVVSLLVDDVAFKLRAAEFEDDVEGLEIQPRS